MSQVENHDTTVFSRAEQQHFFNMLPLSDAQKLQMTRELQRESYDKERGYLADDDKEEEVKEKPRKKRARN